MGGEDEFVPKHVDKRLLAQKFTHALLLLNNNGTTAEVQVDLISRANHKLSSQEARDTFVNIVVEDLAALDGFCFPTPIAAVTYARF
jgi:hypothetical protein